MDLTVKLTTPGSQLSLETLFRATTSIEAIAKRAALETLEEFFASEGIQIDRDEIGRKLRTAQSKTHGGLRLIDARRGSWELTVGLAIGGAIGWVVTEVAKELVKKHPGTKRLSDWLNEKTWTPCAKKTADELVEIQHLGHLKKEHITVKIESDHIGAYHVVVDIKLGKRDAPAIPETSVEQMVALLPPKKKSSKKKGRKRKR